MRAHLKYLFIALIFSAGITPSNGQVLISLLLGDRLNTGKIEFGLDGGVNFSSLDGLHNSKTHTGLHIGFYFDIRLKNQWMLHTGVIVKSPMGADGVAPYPTGDSTLDHLFAGGEVERNLSYFNVPLMLKYSFKNRIYTEAGFQLGLINEAFDKFIVSVHDKGDVSYITNNKKSYHPLDAGLSIGAGWRIIKGYGMNIGVRYYYGLVDIVVDDSTPNVYNRSFYIALGIPVGVGKAKKRAEQKTKSD
jgi:hypothetical protein